MQTRWPHALYPVTARYFPVARVAATALLALAGKRVEGGRAVIQRAGTGQDGAITWQPVAVSRVLLCQSRASSTVWGCGSAATEWRGLVRKVGRERGLRPAVFLDRDSVINQHRSEYVRSWSEFYFLLGVFAPLRRLAESPYAVVVVSNQSAVGRGILGREGLLEIHSRMVEMIERHGGRIDAVSYCPHKPSDRCECRKPRPGQLERASSRLGLDLASSYVVGDALTDLEAALEA